MYLVFTLNESHNSQGKQRCKTINKMNKNKIRIKQIKQIHTNTPDQNIECVLFFCQIRLTVVELKCLSCTQCNTVLEP